MRKEDKDIFFVQMHYLADEFEKFSSAVYTRPREADLEKDPEIVKMRDNYLAFAAKIGVGFEAAGYSIHVDWNDLMEESGAKKRFDDIANKYEY